jgi:hypothetical protein
VFIVAIYHDRVRGDSVWDFFFRCNSLHGLAVGSLEPLQKKVRGFRRRQARGITIWPKPHLPQRLKTA